METLYKNPITLLHNNILLDLVKVCGYFIYSPFEMIFTDGNGNEVKYTDLDIKNKKKANKVFDALRKGYLKFA